MSWYETPIALAGQRLRRLAGQMTAAFCVKMSHISDLLVSGKGFM